MQRQQSAVVCKRERKEKGLYRLHSRGLGVFGQDHFLVMLSAVELLVGLFVAVEAKNAK